MKVLQVQCKSLIGLCTLTDAKLVDQIDYSKIQTSTVDYRSELEDWLNKTQRNWLATYRHGHPRRGLPYLVMFLGAVKGFRRTDERKCLSFLQTNPNLVVMKESLREFKAKNERLVTLVEEFLDWFSHKESLE